MALGWLVYRMTGSKLLLGTVGFLQQAPGIPLTPVAGVISDRINRRPALFLVQLGLLLQALFLAFAIGTNRASVPVILTLCTVQGVLNAFDLPIRQSLVPELVSDRSDLSSAIALNSAIFNLARMIGPALGGVLVALLGEMSCIVANAASFLPILYALGLPMQLQPEAGRTKQSTILGDVAEGLRYTRAQRPFPDLLLLLASHGLFGLSYLVLLPVLARDVLHGGPRMLGLLFAAAGGGSLLAALRLATRCNLRGLLRSIGLSSMIASVAMVLIGVVDSAPTVMLLIAAAGYGFISVSGACNTILQTLVDDNLRGRVLSLYSLSFIAMIPLGNLLLGVLAEHLSVQHTIALFGFLLLMSSGAYCLRLESLRKAARPIYVKRGVIPWQN